MFAIRDERDYCVHEDFMKVRPRLRPLSVCACVWVCGCVWGFLAAAAPAWRLHTHSALPTPGGPAARTC
jgi:hypothetical protein